MTTHLPAPGRLGRPAAWLSCFLLLIAATAPAAAVPRALEAVRVALGDWGEATLPAVVDQQGTRVSLRALAVALGGSIERPGPGRASLEVGGTAAGFSSERPSIAVVGSRTISLGGDTLFEEDDLFVPREAVPRLAALLRESSPTPAPPAAQMRWSLVGAGPGRLRLDLALPSRPGRVSVARRGGEHVIEVELTGSEFFPPWRDKQIGSALVSAVRAEVRDRRLLVTIEPGPQLGEVRTASRENPPGLDVLLIETAGREGAVTEATLARAPGQPLRVVLDPGHGGIEDGAIGPSGLKEKDLVLDVARRLAVLLRLDGFEVTLTRNGDDDISLDDRAGIANEKRADLFVSLHANAARHRGAFGAETFFLAPEASDDEARTLAALENNAARIDDDSGPLTVDGELPLILWDMAQLGYLEESARLARTIQDRLNILLDIRDRGVRQAPFRVLVGATCPAVLVELGFLTNPAEEARLAGGAYRRQLAEALRDAIGTFRAELPREAPVLGGAP